MPRTRVVLGFEPNSLVPEVLYAGADGDLAEKAMKEAPVHLQRFEIFEGPGRRKNNARFGQPVEKVHLKAAVYLYAPHEDPPKERPDGEPHGEIDVNVEVPVGSNITAAEVADRLDSLHDSAPVTEESPEASPAEDPAPRGRRSRS